MRWAMRKKAEQGVPRLRRTGWLLLGACCVALAIAQIKTSGAEEISDYRIVTGDLGLCP
jgi:hypothetical protein